MKDAKKLLLPFDGTADMQNRCRRMSLHAADVADVAVVADVSQFGLSSKLLSQHAY